MRLSKKNKKFWLNQAKNLDWDKYPKVSYSEKKNYWYPNSKINLYRNLIENKMVKDPKKVAIYTFDKKSNLNKYSYEEIDNLVNNFILFLKKKNKKKIKMMIHASSSIESAIAMLSCVKEGIYFSVIFEDLPVYAIQKRVELFRPNIFVGKLPAVMKKISLSQKESNIKFLDFKDIFKSFKKIKKTKSKSLSSNKNFFCLFTSGSTGTPKGVIHKYGGYSVYTKFSCKKQFGMNENSLILTASDAGWINGHTYALFGPLLLGARTILCEKPMLLLNSNNLNKLLSLGVTILYLPVTLIRFMKVTLRNVSIKKKQILAIGSMGEPLAPSVASWYARKFKSYNSAIVNTYFQTETGGIICSPKFSDNIKKSPHGSVGSLISNNISIKKLSSTQKSEFIITKPWPGCMTGVLNSKIEFNKYWDEKGNFKMFDLATKHKNSIYIHGRTDDVINIRGHRIGSEEIESIVQKHPQVSECSAVSINDQLEGQVIYLFIVSKLKDTEGISRLVEKNFGTFSIPKKIYNAPELPKTRSGKILRRLLRQLLENSKNKNFGDLSTIQNPHIIPVLRKQIANEK